MTTYQYVTNSRTGAVHLASVGSEDPRTLCGRFLYDPIIGAETEQARGVTCKTCIRAYYLDRGLAIIAAQKEARS